MLSLHKIGSVVGLNPYRDELNTRRGSSVRRDVELRRVAAIVLDVEDAMSGSEVEPLALPVRLVQREDETDRGVRRNQDVLRPQGNREGEGLPVFEGSLYDVRHDSTSHNRLSTDPRPGCGVIGWRC